MYCFYVSINLVCLWTYHSSTMHIEMVAWLFLWPGTSLFPQLLNFRPTLHQLFVLQYKVNILTSSTLFDSRCIDCFFFKSDCLSLGNRLVLILQASIAAGTLAKNLVKALVTVWFCSCYPLLSYCRILIFWFVLCTLSVFLYFLVSKDIIWELLGHKETWINHGSIVRLGTTQ